MRHIRPEELPARPLARDVLHRFVHETRRLAGDRVRRIIVYGSMARGDAGPESDLDVWVDWQGEEDDAWVLLGQLAGRLFLETGLLLSIHPVSPPHLRLLQDWNNSFYQAVEREGLIVDA